MLKNRDLSSAALCVVAILSAAGSTPAQGEHPVRLRISRQSVDRVLLHMEPIELTSSLPDAAVGAQRVAQQLVTNLIYSDWIALQEPLPAGLRFPPHTPETARGRTQDIARFILRLQIEGEQSGRMALVARLVEPESRTALLAKRYVVDFSQPGRAVHHLADAIVRQLSGEVGLSQTRVVFSRGSYDNREIWLVDFDGEGLRRITRNGSLNLLPRWSPDGSKLCYTSYWQGRQRLLVLDGSTGKSQKIAEYDGLNLGAHWSPDGQELVLTLSHEGDAEIYRIRPDGKIVQRVSFSSAIEASPAYDPTGRQIVYTSDRTGVPQIYVMDKDGTNRRRLTYEGKYNDSAVWSPRGDRIAYVSRRGGLFQIFTVEPDGSNLQEMTLPEDGNNEDPAWAPDGRHLVVSSDRGGRPQLWIFDLDSGVARPLTDGVGDDTTPHWSQPAATDENSPDR
jgi:TolB protein